MINNISTTAAKLTAALATVVFALTPLASYAVDQEGKRIGLVLSGGAARGLSHIGVIRALQEQGIEVDAISGTSMGAIIGGMYASGYSVEQMEVIGTSLDWSYGLTDKPPRDDLTFRRKQDDRRHLLRTKLTVVDGGIKIPAGVIDGQNLDLVLQNIFYHTNDVDNFDQLKIPYRAVATNLETGEAVIMGSGSLNTAIRASMSIPGVLAPVVRDGTLLADGGMADNLPVDVVRGMQVDRVIAVNIGTPLNKAKDINNLFAVSNQVSTFLTIKNAQEQIATLTNTDILLQPDLGDIGSFDFSRAEETIQLGYDAVMAQADALKSFAKNGPLTFAEVATSHAPNISSISFENKSYMHVDALRLFIKQPINAPFDKSLLEHNINTLYGLDYFSSVGYRLLDDGEGGKRLHILINGEKRHTGFMRFGFNTSDDFRGDNYYNLAFAYNKTGISNYGAEWFTHVQLGNDINIRTEFYAPLDYESPFYVLPLLEYTARDISLYDDDLKNEVLLVRDKRTSAGFFTGYQFSNYTDISVGLVRSTGNLNVEVGLPNIEHFNYDLGYVETRFKLDSEDNVYFPTSGSRVDLSARKFDQTLGSDEDYYEADILLSRAFNFGAHTFLTRARAARSDGLNSVPSSRFYLGGLGQLSGMPENSIITQNNNLLSLQYIQQLNKPLLMFDTRYYLIGSIEYGRAWNNQASDLPFNSGDIYAGSIGAAMDSPIGPIVLAYGYNSADRQSVYFAIGRSI